MMHRIRSLIWLSLAFAISVALISLNVTTRSEAAEGSSVPAPGAITSSVANYADLDEFVESLLFEVQSVSLYDISVQRFRVFIPGAPAIVNAPSRELFTEGSVVWVRRSESQSELGPTIVEAPSTPVVAEGDGSQTSTNGLDESPRVFPVPGAGELTFGVSGTSTPSALAAAQPFDVASIIFQDVSTQRFRTYIPGAPSVVNTLTSSQLTPDSIVWIRRANTTRVLVIPNAATTSATPSAVAGSRGATFGSAPTPTSFGGEAVLGSAPAPVATSTPTPEPTLAPSATPVATPTPTTVSGCEQVSSELLLLLNRRIGYAASATGGADGCVYHVTHAGDSGSGSLREGATSAATWVVFDGDFEITLSSELEIASSTTIDGRGRLVTIHGGMLIPSQNVIMTNIAIRNYIGDEYLDGIEIQGIDATNIWLDHISFDVTPDELLPLWAWPTAAHAAGNVTVTWSRFGQGGLSPSSRASNTHGILIGAQAEDGAGSSRTHLTLAFNLFETGTRSPLVGDGARAHIFNNLYSDWGSYGIQVRRNGKVRSEHNIFAEREGARIYAFVVDPDRLLGNEVLYDNGSWFPNDASGFEHNRDAVFNTPYGYTLAPADATLMRDIETGAGATLR